MILGVQSPAQNRAIFELKTGLLRALFSLVLKTFQDQ